MIVCDISERFLGGEVGVMLQLLSFNNLCAYQAGTLRIKSPKAGVNV